MDIIIGGIVLLIVFILILSMPKGYKCPKCGTRTQEIQSTKTIDLTKQKKDGSNDRRYKEKYYDRVTIECKKCKNVFEAVKIKKQKDATEWHKEGDELADKIAKHMRDKAKKNPEYAKSMKEVQKFIDEE
tara:strand:+ start:95 stop:484 length:390 start_codon:yes stop_codon:yes gene_type:complete